MVDTIVFQVPKDIELLGKLLQAIPESWSWLDGYLKFPENQTRNIAVNTGYLISEYNSYPAIVGSNIMNSGKRQGPDLHAIMIERKMPAFVFFKRAGSQNPKDLVAVRDLAASFVRRGYLGSLTFSLGRSVVKATCEFSICISKTEDKLTLKWFEPHGGDPSLVASIMEFCYGKGLRRFDGSLEQRPD